MTAARRLSEDQIDRIFELREDRGYSMGRIARVVGCSEGAVAWRLLTMGVDTHEQHPLTPVPTEPKVYQRRTGQVRRFTQAEDERLLELRAAGLGPKAIGRALNRKSHCITARLHTLARRQARLEAQGQGA